MKRILLLDDNIIACEKSIMPLEQSYEVHRCKEILSAARRIRILDYDLFIIDLMMPTKGLDNNDEFNAGFSFYEKHIKNTRLQAKPTIFWTNLTDESFNEFKQKNGNNIYYLQKSDDSSALLKLVNKVI